MIVKINENEAVELDIDEREFKMLRMCETYNQDPFGSPNHLLMVLVAKLWNYIKEDEHTKFEYLQAVLKRI